jgi:MYXO-CTERM domain-containing protein
MSRFIVTAGMRRRAVEVGAGLAVILAPALARAHFILQTPDNWMSQDATGLPQKAPPCGNESGGTPTNMVTHFDEGATVMFTIDETVTHGGHYRVALAMTQADLPADPDSSVTGSMCEHDDMTTTPMMPVLADGLLQHDQNQPFSAPQTFMVKLPDGFTCDSCVIQVREYMTPHPAPCFYHHCANVTIGSSSGSGGMSSGGAPSGGSGGTGGVSASVGGQGGMSMGGAMGQAGTLISSGGAPGAAGMASGGRPEGMAGAGGAPSGGHNSGAGGAPGGRASGAGGSSETGTSGTSLGAAGTASGTSEAPAPADDKTGCGCRIPAQRGSLPFGTFGALALGVLAARRRRR